MACEGGGGGGEVEGEEEGRGEGEKNKQPRASEGAGVHAMRGLLWARRARERHGSRLCIDPTWGGGGPFPSSSA